MGPQDTQEWEIERVDEKDVDDWANVSTGVFLTPPQGQSIGFMGLFYPNGMTPKVTFWLLGQHLASVRQSNVYYLRIQDRSAPGSPTIACAKWVHVPAKSAAEFEAEEAKAAEGRRDDPSRPAEVRYERLEKFRVAQRNGKWLYLAGRAHMYLQVLAVRPDYQRRGIGKLLMEWGLEKADELGLEGYLEASPAGKGLYEKYGFDVRGLLDWDATRFEGVTFPFTNYAMVRPVHSR